MEILKYPVQLDVEKDGITVTFPDMPYGATFGNTKEEALLNAINCLEEIIASLMKDKRDIPHPSLARKCQTITLSPEFSTKVFLYNAFREQHITKEKLAHRLNWKISLVDRLFDAPHSLQLSQLTDAATALGKILIIGMEDVPQT